MARIYRVMRKGFHWEIAEGGRMSAGSMLVVGCFVVVLHSCLLWGSLAFWRLCATIACACL